MSQNLPSRYATDVNTATIVHHWWQSIEVSRRVNQLECINMITFRWYFYEHWRGVLSIYRQPWDPHLEISYERLSVMTVRDCSSKERWPIPHVSAPSPFISEKYSRSANFPDTVFDGEKDVESVVLGFLSWYYKLMILISILYTII